MVARIMIEERYSGPPSAGNGGYVSGMIAAHLGAGPVTVTLMKPTPLGQSLIVRDAGEDAIMLMDGEEVLVTAERAFSDPTTIIPPAFDDVVRAMPPRDYAEAHLYPGCFVCGPHRHDGDGMCIFPGVMGPGLMGAVWTPPAEFGDRQGRVRTEFIWSALDCPGSFAAFSGVPPRPMVLGRLTISVHDRPPVGEALMVLGWSIAHDGRRHEVGTGLYDRNGRCLAVGQATWIELKTEARAAA